MRIKITRNYLELLWSRIMKNTGPALIANFGSTTVRTYHFIDGSSAIITQDRWNNCVTLDIYSTTEKIAQFTTK